MKLGSAEMVDFGLGEYLTQYPSKRYPIYTRGNAGEVWPEVAYPLTITLTRTVGEEASAQAAINAGVISRKDIVEGPSCFGGVFAGYMYLNLSFGRMIAVRTPGTTIEKSDATYYGSEQQAPKYVPHKNDKNFLASMKLIRYGWRMLHTTEISFLEPDRQLVHHWEERLPKILKSTDQELVSTLREIMQPVMHLFTNHLDVTGQAGGAVQLLSTVCEERLNDRSLALTLLGSLGDVDSAAPSFALWELGRMVANDPTLTSFFDEGITELEERLRESQDCQLFIDNFDSFLKEFGSRGPNEWETACETWGTEPSNVLVLIDRMRLADAEKSPTHRAGQLLKNREQALSDSRSQLKGFGLWIFNKALHGSVLFSQARERSKTTIINLIHVARLISRELAKRTAAQSEKGELIDLWFVLETELDEYINNPDAFEKRISDRKNVRNELSKRIPPFIFQGNLPDPSTWPLREEQELKEYPNLSIGDALEGLGGCPGIAEGIARVVNDPSEPGALGPGDILIAPLTDPSWTPLFVPAEAVVVNVGGQMSHAVIVSRELGMPCVVAVTDATQIIEDGSRIRVNGSSGVVTLLSDPEK
ncbi:MAG: PEP-utilizing enzyme [Acidimicrobiales bacterium]|nr:PEP-utilizing enzyme [Acidimicrobiales bacterium]HJM97247.1 PEP-utilizing enzyme [Acidimicrobiales bacterium]